MRSIVLVLPLLFSSVSLIAQQPTWQGEWITDFGILTIVQSGSKATGEFKRWGTVDGTVSDRKFQFEYKFGQISGTAELELSEDGLSFDGARKLRNRTITWRGWRSSNIEFPSEKIKWDGTWLTSHGTMQLKQDSGILTGSIGVSGNGTVQGTIDGKRLNLVLEMPNGTTKGWMELTHSQQRLFGAVNGDKTREPLIGVRLNGFQKDAEPAAGKIVKGLTDNGMLYFLRMPDGWQSGDQTDLVVLLHGNGWTSEGMVKILSNKWPDIANKFAILGIEGDHWLASSSDEQNQFNYVFDQWPGESNFLSETKSEPGSPDFIIQTIQELDSKLDFQRVFLGGHSLGGHLTHLFHMNYPTVVDGLFPVSSRLIQQADPAAFDETKLKQGRRRPIAIVHGRSDKMVPYFNGRDAYHQYLQYDFEQTKFFNPDAGHGFGGLPIGQAITWLDMMTGNEAARGEFVAIQANQGRWRDVSIVMATKPFQSPALFAASAGLLEKAASVKASQFVDQIEGNRDSQWIEPFLNWKAEFFAANAAQKAIQLYQKLQAEHDALAEPLMKQAKNALANQDRAAAVARCQQIVDEYYASHFYRSAKLILATGNQ